MYYFVASVKKTLLILLNSNKVLSQAINICMSDTCRSPLLRFRCHVKVNVNVMKCQRQGYTG